MIITTLIKDARRKWHSAAAAPPTPRPLLITAMTLREVAVKTHPQYTRDVEYMCYRYHSEWAPSNHSSGHVPK